MLNRKMEVIDLDQDQLTELKQNWYTEYINEVEHRDVFMSEYVDIDNIVSDSTIMEQYKNYLFTSDDFNCTAGQA